ncbi:MOSC domain containing protein [Actinobacteria bacterium OK074]|nr:MOSC domain containing protein [Actinobacteria bacterium OK074]
MGALLTPLSGPNSPQLAGIYRYPVKGMTGLPLSATVLTAGEGIPLDRLLGLRGGPEAGGTADARGWVSSTAFLRLVKNAELGGHRLELADGALLLTAPGGEQVRIGLTAEGRPRPEDIAQANTAIWAWFPERARLEQPGASLWDWPDAPVSVINLDTVAALADAAGVPVDPRRFRANLHVSGLGAWRELDLLGHRVQLGGAELEFTFPTERCRATTVRPGSGERDLNVPGLLATRFGHLYCGVYARVVRGGEIAVGDRPRDLGASLRATPSPYADRLAEPGRPRYAELVRRTAESPTVTSLVFRDPAGARCRPGQHLRLHLADGQGPLWRCYTVTEATATELRVSVKRVAIGRTSTALHALRPGSRVLLSGPYGAELTTADTDRPLLLAAAGIGITPVLPILRALVDTASRRPVTVLNVVRTAAETPLWDEITRLIAKLPDATARLYVTGPGEPLPQGARTGRPGDADLRQLAAGTRVEAYLCGPDPFVDAVRAALRSAGVPPSAVTDERFYSPRPAALREQPPPARGPFGVRFAESGVRATWTADDGTLLDTAESAGLRLPYACRAGACGVCRQRVSGEVAHLSEPAVPLEPDQALLCCAVPVGDVEVRA